MRGDSLGWWIAKAVLSALYWMTTLAIAMGLFFGDRYPTPGSEQQAASDWAARCFAIGAVLIYALLSLGWNRLMTRPARRRR